MPPREVPGQGSGRPRDGVSRNREGGIGKINVTQRRQRQKMPKTVKETLVSKMLARSLTESNSVVTATL